MIYWILLFWLLPFYLTFTGCKESRLSSLTGQEMEDALRSLPMPVILNLAAEEAAQVLVCSVVFSTAGLTSDIYSISPQQKS